MFANNLASCCTLGLCRRSIRLCLFVSEGSKHRITGTADLICISFPFQRLQVQKERVPFFSYVSYLPTVPRYQCHGRIHAPVCFNAQVPSRVSPRLPYTSDLYTAENLKGRWRYDTGTYPGNLSSRPCPSLRLDLLTWTVQRLGF